MGARGLGQETEADCENRRQPLLVVLPPDSVQGRQGAPPPVRITALSPKTERQDYKPWFCELASGESREQKFKKKKENLSIKSR